VLRSQLLHQGKNVSGTLWDQEKEELAIRILMEEGKLNLLLRLLCDFNQARSATDTFNDRLKVGTIHVSVADSSFVGCTITDPDPPGWTNGRRCPHRCSATSVCWRIGTQRCQCKINVTEC